MALPLLCLALWWAVAVNAEMCVAPVACEYEPNYERAVIDVDESTFELRVSQLIPTSQCGSQQLAEFLPVVVSRTQMGSFFAQGLRHAGVTDSFLTFDYLSLRTYTTTGNVSLVTVGKYSNSDTRAPFVCRSQLLPVSQSQQNSVLNRVWCATLPPLDAFVKSAFSDVFAFGNRWVVAVAVGNTISLLDFEDGSMLLSSCVPVIPQAHVTFSTNLRTIQTQNVSSISSLAVASDGSLLAIGTTASIYTNASFVTNDCFGATNETLFGQTWQTTYGWDARLGGNFVIVFSIESLLTRKSCVPSGTATSTTSTFTKAPNQPNSSPSPSPSVRPSQEQYFSPVVFMVDRCLTPVRTISFSPQSVGGGWFDLVVPGDWPTPSSVSVYRLHSRLSTPLSFSKILETKANCRNLCETQNVTTTSCVDSTSFRDRLGGDCTFYSIATKSQNKTCTQLATERQASVLNVLKFCSASCICNIARYNYAGTFCEGYKSWSCIDCMQKLYANNTCVASSCIYANDNGASVLSYCSGVCEGTLQSIESCSATPSSTSSTTTSKSCQTDFSSVQNLVSSGVKFDAITCAVAPATLANIFSALVETQGVVDITWNNDFLSVTTSSAVQLYQNITTNQNTISSQPNSTLLLSSVDEVEFSGDQNMIGLRVNEDWNFFDISTRNFRGLSINSTFNAHQITFGSTYGLSAIYNPSNAVFVNSQISASNTTFAEFAISLSTATRVTAADFSATSVSKKESNSWNFTLANIIYGYEYQLIAQWPQNASDGLYSIVSSNPKIQSHTLLLDHVRPVLTLNFTNNGNIRQGPACGLTSNPFVKIEIVASESTTRLCLGGAKNGIMQTSNDISQTPVLIKASDQTVYPECSSTACDFPNKCELFVAISCVRCNVILSIPKDTVVDVAGNGNEFSSLMICMDRISPIPVFFYNGSHIETDTTVPNPAIITLHFGEPVTGMSVSLLKCDCKISDFVEIGPGLFQFQVAFSSVTTYSLSIEAQQVFDQAGNPNSRSSIALIPEPVHSFVSTDVFIAVVCADVVLILLILITSALIAHYRNSQLIRASSPLFSQLILFGFALVMVANICFAIGMTDFGETVRDQSCTAAVHLLAYGVTLFLAPLVVRSYRVWRVVDNPTLSTVVITTRDLLAVVAAMLLLVALLLAIWTGLGGAKSIVADTTKNSFYVCRYHQPGFLYAVLCLEGICALIGGYIIARIYKTNVDGPFNETKAIAFSFYNSVIVVAVFGIGQSGVGSAETSLGLISAAVVYFVVCPLLVMFWLTKLYTILSHKDTKFSLQSKTTRQKNTTRLQSASANEIVSANEMASFKD